MAITNAFDGELGFVIVPLSEGGICGQLCDLRVGVSCIIMIPSWVESSRPFS